MTKLQRYESYDHQEGYIGQAYLADEADAVIADLKAEISELKEIIECMKREAKKLRAL